MLVTFRTSAYSDITLFGSVAVELLKVMGMSGNVPGAIMAEDLPEAVATLEAALAKLPDETEMISQGDGAQPSDHHSDDDDSRAGIGLGKRAGPLVELLKAAAAANENVMWDQ
ncbi:MAG: DUF1840 domain-containing protein [Granulosicoccus sp.]